MDRGALGRLMYICMWKEAREEKVIKDTGQERMESRSWTGQRDGRGCLGEVCFRQRDRGGSLKAVCPYRHVFSHALRQIVLISAITLSWDKILLKEKDGRDFNWPELPSEMGCNAFDVFSQAHPPDLTGWTIATKPSRLAVRPAVTRRATS